MNPSTLRRRFAPAAAVLSLSLALTACGGGGDGADATDAASGGSAPADLAGSIDGAGASSQQAAMQAWIAGFTSTYPDATINYDPTGSGGGREQFVAGAVQFAGTDAALDEEELAAAATACGEAGVVQFPGYVSPIAIAFNLPGIDALNLSPSVIARIFDRKITAWNDPAIAELNPDATLPATAITPVNRSDESGTTENFTDYLSQAAPEAWTYEASGEWPVAGGESAQGTSGVVGAVTNAEGAITYADASQATELGTAAVQVADGTFVNYSPESAAAIVDAAAPVEGDGDYNFAIELDRTPDTEAYPVVLVSYEVACAQYEDQAQADLVKAFFSYIISEEGQQAAADNAGSAPISDAVRTQAQTGIEAITAAS